MVSICKWVLIFERKRDKWFHAYKYDMLCQYMVETLIWTKLILKMSSKTRKISPLNLLLSKTNHLLVNVLFFLFLSLHFGFLSFHVANTELQTQTKKKEREKEWERTTLKHLIMNNVHIISIEQKSAPIWFRTFFFGVLFHFFFPLPLSLWCRTFFFILLSFVLVCMFQLVFVHF